MLRNQKGQALLLVLLLTTMIFMVGSTALVLSAVARKNAIQETWQKKAYYLAEAGIEMALADLRQRLIYPAPGFEEFSIHNMSYAGGIIEDVQVTRDTGVSDIYTINSSSRYPEGSNSFARKSIRVKVKVVPDPFLSYGGPGLKSDSTVRLTGGVTGTGGSLLARAGDVRSMALIAGNMGGIYAGRDACLEGGITSGGGEVKAGEDVHLSGLLSSWNGKIWAGDEVYGPWWQLGSVTVHEHCGANIPGFPLPDFPAVDKYSDWYNRLKKDALSKGYYYDNTDQFLDASIQWNPRLWRLPWPFDDYYLVNASPRLELRDITVVNDNMVLNVSSLQAAYMRWKENYREQHPGREIFPDDVIPDLLKDLIGGLLMPVDLDVFVEQQGATLVADSIFISEGLLGVFGIDTSNINGPLGLFAVAGDVIYRALIGSGGRLSVIATGKFDCATVGNINLDWVAAKEDVVINAVINLNATQAAVPPGTPVGYRIIAWE